MKFRNTVMFSISNLEHEDYNNEKYDKSKKVDVLLVGPFGTNTEIVFGSSFNPNNHLSVYSMVLEKYWFKTSNLNFVVFPWSLQVDIELTSLYIIELMRYVHRFGSYVFFLFSLEGFSNQTLFSRVIEKEVLLSRRSAQSLQTKRVLLIRPTSFWSGLCNSLGIITKTTQVQHCQLYSKATKSLLQKQN